MTPDERCSDESDHDCSDPKPTIVVQSTALEPVV